MVVALTGQFARPPTWKNGLPLRMDDEVQIAEQRRDLEARGVPDNIRIDVEIAVDQPVSHVSDCGPGNFWTCRTRILGDLAGSLSEDFNCAYDCEEEHLIRNRNDDDLK